METPVRDTSTRNALWTIVAILSLVIVVFVGYQVVSSVQEFNCAMERSERAIRTPPGEPLPQEC